MLLNQEELERSAVMDTSIAEFMKANPSPAINWEDWQANREMMNQFQEMTSLQIGPADPSVLTESYVPITYRDNVTVNLKVHAPVNAPTDGSPLIVLNYGGGFISGSVEQMTVVARMYVKAFGAVVVNSSYRRAPENLFPCAQLDVWDTVKWCAENAETVLNANPRNGFVVGGVSAGGQLTACVATMAIEEPLSFPITGQWLSVPSVMGPEHTPEKFKKYHLSYEHNKDTPILSSQDMAFIESHMKSDESSPLRYPVLSKAPLSKQPKAFIQADGLDPLRDDALIWDEMLKEAGVQTRVELYRGCPHAHWSFMPGTEISLKAITDIITGMGWLLGKDVSQADVMKAIM